MKYNLCLFDLDGTITDSKLGITKSFQYALSAFGIHEGINNLTRFIGPSLRESFRISFGLSATDTEKAIEKYREYFANEGLNGITIYPGILEILQELKRKGLLLAVVTNKVTAYAKSVLKHFDIDTYFDFVSGDEMDGSLTKDGKRELVRNALNALDPNRKMSAVMIGDRKQDIQGGFEMGIDSIGVTWGYGTRSELEEAGSTWIVEAADDLYRLITE